MRNLPSSYNSTLNAVVQGLGQPLCKHRWGIEVSRLLPVISVCSSHLLHQATRGTGTGELLALSKSAVAVTYVSRVQKSTQKRLFHQSRLELKGLVYHFFTI